MAIPIQRKKSQTGRCHAACAFLSLLALPGLCSAQEERIAVTPLPSVAKLLAGRSRPGQLTCELQGISRLPKDEIQPGLPAQPRESPQRRSYCIDFRNSRFRRALEWEVYLESHGFHTEFQVDTFDGAVFKEYLPKDLNPLLHSGRFRYHPEVTFRKKGPRAFIPQREDVGVLFAAGELPLSERGMGDVTRLGRPFDITVYEVVGRAEMHGRECFIVHNKARDSARHYYEIWIAPALSNATVRAALRVRGFELFRIELSYDNSLQPHRPTRMRYFSGDMAGLELRGDFQFTKFDTDSAIASALFDTPIAPGMIVQDLDRDERYKIGLPGERPVSVRTLAAQESPGTGFARLAMTLGALALGAVSVFMAWFWRRP